MPQCITAVGMSCALVPTANPKQHQSSHSIILTNLETLVVEICIFDTTPLYYLSSPLCVITSEFCNIV